jgi:hypothetical protein
MLVQGSFKETMEKFKAIVEKEKPAKIISVGDTVSKNLTENDVFPDLLIVDNKVMRKPAQPAVLQAEETVYVQNSQGTITEEAIKAIKEALKADHHVKIVIDGEEDLLTLIAVLYAPDGSFVVYGQPLMGIVLVKVTEQKKAEILNILNAMEKASKN